MSSIINARRAGRLDGEFVVFLIGMRVNRWWKIHKWLPVVLGMGRMLRELGEHPELGLLGQESWFGRTTVMVSYWRSIDHLMAYAKSASSAHLPAWKAFNKAVGTSGDVGIWHETYKSRPGDHESVYANMPLFGLAKAGASVEASGELARAAGRLAASGYSASSSSSPKSTPI